MHDSLNIFKCLSDASRLQIVAGLAREPMYVERIAERMALAPSTVSFHMKKLEAAGVVKAEKEQYYTVYSLIPGLLGKTLGEMIAPEGTALSVEEQREALYRQRVVDAFMADGRLVTIPAQRKKRRIILEMIAEKFTPGVRYSEREVNLIISEWHDDFCTLRRELIIERLMDRENGGAYWRSE